MSIGRSKILVKSPTTKSMFSSSNGLPKSGTLIKNLEELLNFPSTSAYSERSTIAGVTCLNAHISSKYFHLFSSKKKFLRLKTGF